MDEVGWMKVCCALNLSTSMSKVYLHTYIGLWSVRRHVTESMFCLCFAVLGKYQYQGTRALFDLEMRCRALKVD
jgi:hypothetical protein